MDTLFYLGTLLTIPIIYALTIFGQFFLKIYSARRSLLKNFPTPPGYNWFIGHLNTFPGLTEEGLLWLRLMAEKYPRYYVIIIGPTAILQLNHPQTIKELTKTVEPKQLSYGGGYRALIPWIGNGLLLSSGSKWQRNRKLLTPGFHFDVLKPYLGIYNNCTDKLLDIFYKQSTLKRQSIEIFQPINHCALDIILQCAFSSKQNIQDRTGNQQYARVVKEIGKQIVDRMLKPWIYNDFIYYKTKAGKQFRENCAFSHQVADDVIEKRRVELKEITTVQNLSTKRYIDFLDILLLAKDSDGNCLTQQEIRDEVETFMFEGHDTTTSGISWILYNLAKHPQIQAKVQGEVDALLTGRESDALEWNDMNELFYLTCCIKESLRLHPPVLFIGRELTKDLIIDGKIIPAQANVIINIWNLHHNPSVWKDPMLYNPDRFLPENLSKKDSHAFLSFSAGPRNCIGQTFAMNEMRTTIARIVRRFEVRLDESREVHLHPDVVLRPRNGIFLYFNERSVSG